MARPACKVLLVSPRFDFPSFWSLNAACEVTGKGRTEPPLGLITVAALLPRHWQLRLLDHNFEDLTGRDLAWADLVMTGGMIPQRPDALRIVDRCRDFGKPVVVGGPDVTSSPQVFERADFRVLGEAEGVIETFIRAWEAGARRGTFEAEKFQVDVSASPLPRFDLVRHDRYLAMAVQFSRGCPFTCEFCDIIELYGRVPRTKTPDQMLAELDALYRLGYRGHVDFVDDNLIGNKKAVRAFLPHLCEWQKKHGYPFTFSTQASINLADDDAFLQLMRAANFTLVFVGIESPDTDTLVSAQKKQNTRRQLAECIRKLYRAGMIVQGGFILGFDVEKREAIDEMMAFIDASSIALCMVGLLTALPGTQMARRLAREGRLQPVRDFDFYSDAAAGDQCTEGLNFDTVRPRREILDDYRTILDRIYRPEAFFERARMAGRQLDRPNHKANVSLRVILGDLRTLGRFFWRLAVRGRGARVPFLRAVWDCFRHDPRAAREVLALAVTYLHVGPFSRRVIAHLDREIAQIDSGEQVPRRHVPALPKTPAALVPAAGVG